MTGRQYQARDCKWRQSEVDDIELRMKLIFAKIIQLFLFRTSDKIKKTKVLKIHSIVSVEEKL